MKEHYRSRSALSVGCACLCLFVLVCACLCLSVLVCACLCLFVLVCACCACLCLFVLVCACCACSCRVNTDTDTCLHVHIPLLTGNRISQL